MSAWARKDEKNLQHYKDMLQIWRDCEKAIAQNQSYTVGDKSFTKVDARHVMRYVKDYEEKIERLENSKIKGKRPRRGPAMKRVVFLND